MPAPRSADAAKPGHRDPALAVLVHPLRLEDTLDLHAHVHLVESGVDERGHHPRPLCQLDYADGVGDAVPKGGHRVLVDDRVRVDGATTAGLSPLQSVTPAPGTARSGVVIVVSAGA